MIKEINCELKIATPGKIQSSNLGNLDPMQRWINKFLSRDILLSWRHHKT